MRDRKHALIRVGKGDYLLLSNDTRALWRLATYREDGSAVVGKRFLTGTFWGVWKYKKAPAAGPIDPADWNDFEMHECLIVTRRDAIEHVLAQEPDGADRKAS